MYKLLMLLIFILSACSTTEQIYVEHTGDKIAEQIGYLRQAPIERGAKEIRLWVNHTGIRERVESLAILKIAPNGDISGRQIYIPVGHLDEYDHWKSNMYHTCDEIVTYEAVEACVNKNSSMINWQEFHGVLSENKIWTLPNESELPDAGGVVLHGLRLHVELRDGDHYREYSYHERNATRQPEVVNAHLIMDTMLELNHRLMEPVVIH